MATFALPKDNDRGKHKDQDHQIHDNKQNIKDYYDAWYDTSTVAYWDVITDFNTVGKGGLGVNNGQFAAGHILCCHCNYILDNRPDLTRITIIERRENLPMLPVSWPSWSKMCLDESW